MGNPAKNLKKRIKAKARTKQRRIPQLPAELVERILELAMLSIDLHPPHLDELDALPASEELELERRYARSREINPELYVLGARCCLVSRRWNVISRRLLYTSIKMEYWPAPWKQRTDAVFLRTLQSSPSLAAIITSFSCQAIPENYVPQLLPLLPNLVQLNLQIVIFVGLPKLLVRDQDTPLLRNARFDHLRRLSLQYPKAINMDHRGGWGYLRPLLKVLSTVSTLEYLDLGSFLSVVPVIYKEDGFDWEAYSREPACPIPSFSLKYLRLAHMRFNDYDLSPLVAASSSSLQELVLDDFGPVDINPHDETPIEGIESLRRAIGSCYGTLERLTLRRVFDPLAVCDLLLPPTTLLLSLRYLYIALSFSDCLEIRQRLSHIAAPVLRHLVLQHDTDLNNQDLFHGDWLGAMLVERRFPSLETLTLDAEEIRGDHNGYVEGYLSDLFSRRAKLEAAASSVGVEFNGALRMSACRPDLGLVRECFHEVLDMLDLGELLSLRGSYLSSESETKRLKDCEIELAALELEDRDFARSPVHHDPRYHASQPHHHRSDSEGSSTSSNPPMGKPVVVHECRWVTAGAECPLSFIDAEELYTHITSTHIGRKSAGTLSLECYWSGCTARATKRDHLTSHVRVHIDLKPHTCSVCSKSFKRPQDLKKHERIHTEVHHQHHKQSKAVTVRDASSKPPPPPDYSKMQPMYPGYALYPPMPHHYAPGLNYGPPQPGNGHSQPYDLAQIVAEQQHLNAMAHSSFYGMPHSGPPMYGHPPIPSISQYPYGISPFAYPTSQAPHPMHPTSTSQPPPPSPFHFGPTLAPGVPQQMQQPRQHMHNNYPPPSLNPQFYPTTPQDDASSPQSFSSFSAGASPNPSLSPPGGNYSPSPENNYAGSAGSGRERKRAFEDAAVDFLGDLKHKRISESDSIRHLDALSSFLLSPPPNIELKLETPSLTSDLSPSSSSASDYSQVEVDSLNELLLSISHNLDPTETPSFVPVSQPSYPPTLPATASSFGIYPTLPSNDGLAFRSPPVWNPHPSIGAAYHETLRLAQPVAPPSLALNDTRNPHYRHVERLSRAPPPADTGIERPRVAQGYSNLRSTSTDSVTSDSSASSTKPESIGSLPLFPPARKLTEGPTLSPMVAGTAGEKMSLPGIRSLIEEPALYPSVEGLTDNITKLGMSTTPSRPSTASSSSSRGSSMTELGEEGEEGRRGKKIRFESPEPMDDLIEEDTPIQPMRVGTKEARYEVLKVLVRMLNEGYRQGRRGTQVAQ